MNMAEDQDKNNKDLEKIVDDIIDEVFKDLKLDDENEDKEEEWKKTPTYFVGVFSCMIDYLNWSKLKERFVEENQGQWLEV